MSIAWIYLLIAGLFEAAWAIGLKYSQGFSRLWPSVFTIIAMGISLYFLGLALKNLPVGTAYAVWTGIGAVGTVLIGIFFFKESVEGLKLFFIFLLIASIIGLKLVSTH